MKIITVIERISLYSTEIVYLYKFVVIILLQRYYSDIVSFRQFWLYMYNRPL
jgi:hypothetical protein